MRLWTDGERRGIESDPHDADLARAGRDLLLAGVETAEVLGFVSGDATDGEPGDCAECSKDDAPVRPWPVFTDAGEPVVIEVCADCQDDLTRRVVASMQGDSDEETVPVETEVEE